MKQTKTKKVKPIKLTQEDMHNLYDLLYMINWSDYSCLKLNKMDKWMVSLFNRLEERVVPEIKE